MDPVDVAIWILGYVYKYIGLGEFVEDGLFHGKAYDWADACREVLIGLWAR